MEYTPLQKKMLQDIGRTETGRVICEVLDQAKAHYSSIATIDTTRPTDAQIEGRKLFGEFIDELTSAIKVQKRQAKPLQPEDYT